MSLLTNRVKMILSSKTIFRWVVISFIVQAVLSAFFVAASTPVDGVGGGYAERNENGVVPDGHRHLGAIYYYSELPVGNGPVIDNMDENDLWMGDLERFPSYFYYYVLSFPVRIATALNVPDTGIVILVRLIGVVFGVAILFVFRRIVQLASRSQVVENLSVLALALTGSFVWLVAAENYDVLAMLFWFLFMYASMRLFIEKNTKYLYWMATWFVFLGVTKYTYIPFMVALGIASLVLYIKNTNNIRSMRVLPLSLKKDYREWLKTLAKWRIIAGVFVLLVGATLFTERIVGNLATYQAFNPNCAAIHSHQGCMNFGVYARNYNQKVRLGQGTIKPIEYVPGIGYPAYWVKRYFDSMYVYMGHVYIPVYSLLIEIGGILTAIAGLALIIIARIKKIRLVKSQAEWYLLGTAVFLTVTQFVYNLGTILEYGGQTYGHQGRYLLSAVGFFYIMYFVMARRVYQKLTAKGRRRLVGAGLVLAVYSVFIISAVPSFIYHADEPAWYSDSALRVLPDWLTNRS